MSSLNSIEYWAEGYEHLSKVLDMYEPSIISERDEGNVYLYEELDVVVKERARSRRGRFGDVCNICVKREFDIGILANQYNSRHLVKTLGYYERDGNSYVVTEYVNGISLGEFIMDNEWDETKLILLHVFDVIRELQHQMDFTHYDLHPYNIIVVDNQDEESINHIVKFIDLSRSHIRGIGSSYAEVGLVDEVMTPGVFDPVFDYFFFMSIIYNTYEISHEELEFLFERNNITIDNGYGYPVIADNYVIGDLFQNHKVWASTVPNDMTMTEVYAAYARDKIRYSQENGMQDEIDLAKYELELVEIDSRYEIEIIADTMTDIKVIGSEDPKLQLIIDEYVILLGEAAVHDKLEMLEGMDDAETVHEIITRTIRDL